MHQNQVRYLLDPPEGIVPIGCKWIFKSGDTQVDTFKARLVAKGYRQRQGVDHIETFAPDVVDPLTKPLAHEVSKRHRICMGLMYKYDWL